MTRFEGTSEAMGMASGDHPQTILLADDEPWIRRVLHTLLTARGYLVYEASTGEEVLDKAPVLRPDVILLDLGLPDVDGIQVAQRLRRSIRTQIIVLSVRATEADKIGALEAGVDDYLTKPFQPSELIERVRAALLREKLPDTPVFVAGDLTVDLDNHMVQIGDRPVELTPSEYAVLKVFVLNAGRLLTHRQLANEVWGESAGALEQLRTAVGALRQKLEADPARPRHILTESGVGYRLRTEP